MKKSSLPTDVEIMQCIHEQYFDEYIAYQKDDSAGENKRQTKQYVPIDIERISEILNMDKHLLFGRLYYDMNNRYKYVEVPFFSAFNIPGDRHCINFPYLSGVLAKEQTKDTRNKRALSYAKMSMVIAAIAVFLQFAIPILSGMAGKPSDKGVAPSNALAITPPQ